MRGKIALVTGGSRGIGRAIAIKLASSGADVAILYAGNAVAAQEVLRRIAESGVRAMAIACDVSDQAQVTSAYQQVKETLGAVDILVNNAGITRDRLAMRMRAEDFSRVISVNLAGAFHLIHAVLPDFVRRRSGRIINISSVSGLKGNAGQANYSAAKAGLIGLTKAIAREVASRGITCNAVAPGFVKTDMTAAMNEQALEAALAEVPMGRIGEAEDIAEAVAFLASEAAAYITGAVLPVDGGMAM
ncbi:MAG: 3-oxoacyl-[acyl-carrier-protein] reductase [Clostridia bacterium]